MRVRFEHAGNLISEVTFPHAELPLGETVLISTGGERLRYTVGVIDMLVQNGELIVVVAVTPTT